MHYTAIHLHVLTKWEGWKKLEYLARGNRPSIYLTLHYITLHYITLHYITLHYITLHYITLHYLTFVYK